jgi:hypothetical protein
VDSDISDSLAHTTTASTGTDALKNISTTQSNSIDEDMGDMTIRVSNHNCSGVNETHVNTNITIDEGNGEHCITNEDYLGDESMDNLSDHQVQGKLRKDWEYQKYTMN